MSNETPKQMVDRVRMMVSGKHSNWDLSPNDLAALAHVLSQLDDKPSTLTEGQLVRACENIGFDLSCGDCACLFFTGAAGYGCDPDCETVPKREPLTITSTGEVLCEGGCGTTEEQTGLTERRHGLRLCENCAWEHDHGEEDCGWQCEEIPAALRETHRKGKCGKHCPNPKTWAAEPSGEEPKP